MRIGQFVSFGLGGADKSAYSLVKGLLEEGIDVKVFYNELSFPKRSKQIDSDVLLSRYDHYKELGVGLIKIDNLSDLNNYDLDLLVTHRSGDDMWWIPGFEETKFNFKVIEQNFQGGLKTKADIRIFPSFEMIKNKKIEYPYYIIPNAIMCKLTDENLRVSLGLENKFIFGKIGRPSIDHYSLTCLKAFKLIENESVFFLYIASHQIAIDDSKKLHIKNIIFLDQTIDNIDISKIYNTFDVFCHGNIYGETFGNTIAESMIHGRPVISHWGNIGGYPQAQKEVIGRTDYICDDAIQYSGLMSRLFENKKLYEEYSNYVQTRANVLFDYRIIAKRHIEIYKRVLEGRA